VLIACVNAGLTAVGGAILVGLAGRSARRYGYDLSAGGAIYTLVAIASVAAGFLATGSYSDVSRDVLLAGLAVCAWTDHRIGLIFDLIVTTCGGIVFIVTLSDRSTLSTIVASAACGSALLLLWIVSRGRGIGLGDVKLAALLGAAQGLTGGMISLGVAFIAGACYVVLLSVLSRLPENRSIALGPFLALGSALAMAVAAR
jgi:prepilin signal peptidase PulO-like enzyme (type II secretory pathway)